jgi:hypothetical protein
MRDHDHGRNDLTKKLAYISECFAKNRRNDEGQDSTTIRRISQRTRGLKIHKLLNVLMASYVGGALTYRFSCTRV